MFASNSYAWIKIEKANKGLFGYKYVNEDHTSGSHMLACAEPGWNGCNWDNPPTFDDGNFLDLDDYLEIESEVESKIESGVSSGDFLFETIYVEFTYDQDLDRLVMKLYSKDEARELGLL